MKVTVKPKSATVGTIKKSNPLKPGVVLCSISSDEAKHNASMTLRGDHGFWTVPRGSNGEKVIVGDEFWMRNGVNEQSRDSNCIDSIWVVQDIIECGTPSHAAVCEMWERESKWDTKDSAYSTRRIVVLARKQFLKKDEMTYQDLIDLCKKKPDSTKLQVQDARLVF